MHPSTSHNRILVTGTVAYDHLFSYDATFLENLRNIATLEVLSVSFYTRQYAKRYGGTGANISWNIALLSGNPLLVADVGHDGEEYVQRLKKAGVDTSGISVHPTESTSTGVSCTDTKQHQIWFFHRGADAHGKWPTIKNTTNIGYAIIGQRDSRVMLEGVAWCKKHGIPVLFDPGQEIRNFKKEDLEQAIEGCAGLIGNEFEWEMLNDTLKTTPEKLSQRVEYAIMTKAEKGHDIYKQGKKMSFPRCNWSHFENPTGAGDAFRGGMLTGLVHGYSLEDASMLGAAMASFVVEQEGSLLDKIDRKLVIKRAEETLGKTLPQF